MTLPLVPVVSYQYVVLRCVPRVDREEFVNVGVVLHSQGADFLDCDYAADPGRLRCLAPDLDLASVDATLETLCSICRGEPAPGRPWLAGLGQRFCWILAPLRAVVPPGCAA